MPKRRGEGVRVADEQTVRTPGRRVLPARLLLGDVHELVRPPRFVARELLEGGSTQQSDTDDSDDDGSEERGQSGTKGTGSAG